MGPSTATQCPLPSRPTSPPSSVTAVEPSLPVVAPTSTMVCSLWVTTALQTTSSSRTAGAHPGETTATCKSAPAATSAASTASPATPRSAVPFRFECSLNDCIVGIFIAVALVIIIGVFLHLYLRGAEPADGLNEPLMDPEAADESPQAEVFQHGLRSFHLVF